ncbi:MAG: UDP-N-acetylmuramoyl-L-alanyl-D-glutamate--2,6-diaminopimelate ligase [Nitrospirales bacterium]|nr:UDP-N-acetylmuramoyl-L-alanyl-D-glutamate--2,6-diaminopimelate ligase [Nitrospira sp.]MDR4500470.1 UDP-N-acetylmuramoyl-L-alanyl-D-glutamate--2,6-diaminopimelate ligase [Nitrospirales bacterium]
MTIAELIQPLHPLDVHGDLDREVLDVTDDSRRVRQGSLFVAVRGTQVDGHEFARQACLDGAVGVVLEESPMARRIGQVTAIDMTKPTITVRNSKEALGCLASRLHGDPSLHLNMVGVTGTNGKTTVTHLIRALLDNFGEKTGVIGTVGYFIGADFYPASHTTPGAVQLQELLARMVEAGLDTAILEVSSHALALGRVSGCEFDVAVFTNLTQDHLDFHADMQEYFEAKQRLFTDLLPPNRKTPPKRAVVNIDDEWGIKLAGQCSVPVWTYGIRHEADIQAHEIVSTLDGTQFRVTTPTGEWLIRSQLVGEHNVYNILSAIAVALEFGMSSDLIVASIASVKNVPGRFERITQGQDFTVIVDYAHTEDALLRVLLTAQSLKRSKIITVFGCGGDRDTGKRPKMGQVAVRHSDLAILTSDNPRTEDPMTILNGIEEGILKIPKSIRSDYRMIPDRREAIEAAIAAAEPGDIVLIAGKGHEDYQIVGTERLNFDDRQVAREALQHRVRVK